MTLDRLVVGEEYETTFVGAAKQNTSPPRFARRIDRRHDHCIGLGITRCFYLREPNFELFEGVVEHVGDVHPLDVVTDSMIREVHPTSLA